MITLAKLNAIPGRPEWLEAWIDAPRNDSVVQCDTNGQAVMRCSEHGLDLFNLARTVPPSELLTFALYATRVEVCVKRWQATPATPEDEHESTALHLAEHLAEKGVNREIAVQLMTRWAIAYAMPDPIPAVLSQNVRNVCDRAFNAAQHKREERRLREQRESYNRSSGIGWSND